MPRGIGSAITTRAGWETCLAAIVGRCEGGEGRSVAPWATRDSPDLYPLAYFTSFSSFTSLTLSTCLPAHNPRSHRHDGPRRPIFSRVKAHAGLGLDPLTPPSLRRDFTRLGCLGPQCAFHPASPTPPPERLRRAPKNLPLSPLQPWSPGQPVSQHLARPRPAVQPVPDCAARKAGKRRVDGEHGRPLCGQRHHNTGFIVGSPGEQD
jgi:hypothetical protein